MVDKKIIYFGTAGRNSAAASGVADFTINIPLDLPLQGAGGYAYKTYLSQAVIPNDFLITTPTNGAYNLSLNGGAQVTYYLPIGSLNDETLVAYFISKQGFSNVYIQNGRLIFTAATPFTFNIPVGSVAGKVLGLPTGVNLDASAITNNPGELTGTGTSGIASNNAVSYRLIGSAQPYYQPLLVQIRSSLVTNSFELEQGGTSIGVSTILASIPNKSDPAETLVWSDVQGANATLLPSTAELNSVRLWLTDEYGTPLQSVRDCHFTLVLEKTRDDTAAITTILKNSSQAAQESVRLQRVQVVQKQLEEARRRSKFYRPIETGKRARTETV